MKKIMFLLFFSLTTICYGQSSYEKFLNCQTTAVENYGDGLRQCRETNTRFEQSKCLSSVFRKFSIDSCSQALSNQLNSLSFMYRELSEIDNPMNSKFYSASKREQLYSELRAIINEELKLTSTISRKELDSRETQFINERANRNFNRALSILGAQVQNSNNSTSNQTFIINGRIINCSTYQNITNCN